MAVAWAAQHFVLMMFATALPSLSASTDDTFEVREVTISNIQPRRDTSGAILDAHDGNFVFDGDRNEYLYFAAGYGTCEEPPGLNGCASWSSTDSGCGFLFNHSVNLYSSPDLVRWTAHGNVLPLGPPRPNATLFCPKAVFNARTATWVLWYNLYPPYNYAVAVAASPAGPFRTISTTVALSTQYGALYNNSGVGDFSLFVDDNGDGYILYSSKAHVQASLGLCTLGCTCA